MLAAAARTVSKIIVGRSSAAALTSSVRNSHHKVETPEEWERKCIDRFNDPNSDGWWIRKVMTEIHHKDAVPVPEIVSAGLRACRRVNDFALAVRFLESVKSKCGNRINEFWPYIIQEIRPTLDELGIATPDEMGYDKPELWIPDGDYWWPKEYYDTYKIRRFT